MFICDLSDFDRGTIVGARQSGLSISETADLLGFSHTAVSSVCREWCKKLKTSSEQQFCRQKRLVNERGQRRRARLVRQGGDSNANNHTLQSWYAEEHL